MRKTPKGLIAVIALAVGMSGIYIASEAASTITSKSGTVSAGNGAASVSSNTSSNVGNSVSSNTSSVVTNSSNSGSTSSVVTSNNTTSTCSTDINGSRCEVTCAAPQTAQCLKMSDVRRPTCFCQ